MELMKVTERQKEILDRIIREYVDTAKPVSSQYLENKYDFGICPASIRIEMQKLTDCGFLCQPHTSAGRVPTDQGYRFYVDEIMKGNNQGFREGLEAGFEKGTDEEFEDVFRLAQSLTRNLASASSSLVLSYMTEEDVLLKDGWEQVLRNPELQERDSISNFIDFLEYLESNVEDLKPQSGFNIHIGGENLFPKAGDFSVITFKSALNCEPAQKEEIILSIVGPKRMPYDKNIGLINSVMKMFDELQ